MCTVRVFRFAKQIGNFPVVLRINMCLCRFLTRFGEEIAGSNAKFGKSFLDITKPFRQRVKGMFSFLILLSVIRQEFFVRSIQSGV